MSKRLNHNNYGDRIAAKQVKIVKHVGMPVEAVTLNDVTVYRKDKFYIPEWQMEASVAPYDDHFLYENRFPNQPAYMCTCGAAAVVVDGLFVCLQHLTTGQHQTGGSRWV